MMTDNLEQSMVNNIQALQRFSLQLVQETSIPDLLAKLAGVAGELVETRCIAVGLLGEQGEWDLWESSGFVTDELRRLFDSDSFHAFAFRVVCEGTSIHLALPSAQTADGESRVGHPLMGVPIRLQEKVIGEIVTVGRTGREAFTSADEWIIGVLAAVSGVAIGNARSYARLQAGEIELTQRNRELSIVNDISVAASTTLELEGILATTLDRMMLHFNALHGEVFLTEEETGQLRIALQRGNLPASYWETGSFAVGEGFVGRVAVAKDMLAVVDPLEESGFNQDIFKASGLRMLFGIPLLSKGRILGVMILASREAVELASRQKALFEAVGLSVGTAVENGLLHRKSQRLAVLEERERIGMDLHDGIIQSIYAVGLMLEECLLELEETSSGTKPKVERAIIGLNGVIRDIRAYINNLQPQRFIFDNLAIGLDLLVREFLVNTPVTAETDLSQEAARGLAPATANTLFHIAQEALANVTRHAHATRVRLSLEQVEDRVVLEVADNGCGFDHSRRDALQGNGLANMEERARSVRGELAILSGQGQGTRVRVSIPRIRPQTGNLAGRLPRSGTLRQ